MAAVSLLNVTVQNNPAPISSNYEFEITFECLESLSKDLEWKLTYVGSATSSEHDQELDSLLVGPIPVGVNKFVFEADPPDLSRIPSTEILGVTVILLTCSYDGREFVRVGYYVNNEYTDESLANEPPQKPIMEKMQRNILAEKPRVTRFAIKWDSEESAPPEFPAEQPEADTVDDDASQYGAEEEDEGEEEEAEAVEAEVAGEETATVTDRDTEMAGAAGTDGVDKDVDAASDAGSEDLEAESSGEDDEDEEEDGEGEGEGEVEGENEGEGGGEDEGEAGGDETMADGDEAATNERINEQEKDAHPAAAAAADVMVH